MTVELHATPLKIEQDLAMGSPRAYMRILDDVTLRDA
jgi:hypothetical protein